MLGFVLVEQGVPRRSKEMHGELAQAWNRFGFLFLEEQSNHMHAHLFQRKQSFQCYTKFSLQNSFAVPHRLLLRKLLLLKLPA